MGEMLDYIYYNMYNTCFVVVVCVLNGIFLRAQKKDKEYITEEVKNQKTHFICENWIKNLNTYYMCMYKLGVNLHV